MIFGILAGIIWALETVVLGIALNKTVFISTPEALFLAPFIATFLHDATSAILMFIYNAVRGNLKSLAYVFKTPELKWLLLASAIGGPVGMTGYVLAINYMGASVGAVASAIYPAIGTAIAFVFLRERTRWYQWLFLFFTLLGVFGLSYSPSVSIENFWLGLLGAFMCAFGWGIEAVILAKCFKSSAVKNECALNIRQAVSALIYGLILLPILDGWDLTVTLFKGGAGTTLLIIAIAALCATVSYMFYYKAISKIGASRAMALNITYTAWSILFSVIILRSFSVLEPLTIVCALVIVVCGILAATDIKKLIFKDKS